MSTLVSIHILLACMMIFTNCGCSSTRQNTQSKKLVATKVVDTALDLTKYKTLPIKANSIYVLKSNWDLEGETYVLPNGVTLKGNGGVFKNGTLIGNNTKIDTKKALFDKVSIQGNWIDPVISTRMFASLDYENSLRDVLALTHSEIVNKVIIEKGEYSVSAKSFQPALTVGSNVELVIDGNIRLLPNEHMGCYVLMIKDASNVTISGSGCIYGDKYTHLGVEGEWGHGINVISSANISIKGLNIKDCWGDCIYVGGSSKNVEILDCKLDNGRRQGISITSADRVTIEDCEIKNVSGTNPQAAIDIEPNHNDTVDNIVIRNVHCENCYGGIMSWRPEDARIGELIIDGCKIINTQNRYPIAVLHAENASVENCIVDADDRTAIMATQVENIVIKNNTINSTSKSPVTVLKCKKSDVKNNTIHRNS